MMSFLRFRIPMDVDPWSALAELKWAVKITGGQTMREVLKGNEMRVVVSHPSSDADAFWHALYILQHVRSLSYPNAEGF